MISKSRLPGQSPNCLRCRKPGYAMPADAVPVVGAKAVWSAMTGLFFCAHFPRCCCRKITPLIFRRSTKFTGTGAHFSAECTNRKL